MLSSCDNGVDNSSLEAIVAESQNDADVNINSVVYSYGAKVNPGKYFGLVLTAKANEELAPGAVYLIYDGVVAAQKLLSGNIHKGEFIFNDEYFRGQAVIPAVPSDAEKESKNFRVVYATSVQDPLVDGKILLADSTSNYKREVRVE